MAAVDRYPRHHGVARVTDKLNWTRPRAEGYGGWMARWRGEGHGHGLARTPTEPFWRLERTSQASKDAAGGPTAPISGLGPR